MAKKRQSSQSVRRSAKRREEEAKQRRSEAIRNIAVIVVVALLLAGGVYLLLNLGSDDLGGEQVASEDQPATEPSQLEEETETADQAAPLDGAVSEAGEPGPLAALAPEERFNYYDQAPQMVIDPEKAYEALIQTEKGDMRLQLFAEESPVTVNNFVFLAREGYYDGTIFHRVLQDFMAQGGDPTGTGGGGPGYEFEDETDNGLAFDRPGLLAMANRGPNTNGSQFFITFVPTPHLNGAHTIFGEIVEGEDVLNSLTFVQPGQPGGDVIERITIVEG